MGSDDASDTAETLERGYIFRDGHMFTMPGLGGRNTFASGINNENQIVGISQNPQGVYDGFLYANGRMQSIGGKQSSNFTPIKINDHGELAGTLGDQDGNSHACRLFQTGTNAGLILSIDNFPGSVFSSSVATGINNGGEISGYCWAFAIGESVMGIPFPGEVPATTKI